MYTIPTSALQPKKTCKVTWVSIDMIRRKQNLVTDSRFAFSRPLPRGHPHLFGLYRRHQSLYVQVGRCQSRKAQTEIEFEAVLRGLGSVGRLEWKAFCWSQRSIGAAGEDDRGHAA